MRWLPPNQPRSHSELSLSTCQLVLALGGHPAANQLDLVQPDRVPHQDEERAFRTHLDLHKVEAFSLPHFQAVEVKPKPDIEGGSGSPGFHRSAVCVAIGASLDTRPLSSQGAVECCIDVGQYKTSHFSDQTGLFVKITAFET